MSKYDNIKTAEDMLREVKMHGLSTAQEDLNRVADIFGNSTVGALDLLANNVDWHETFYFVLSDIWNWREVVRFFNQHSNPQMAELAELRKSSTGMKRQLDDLKARRETLEAALRTESTERLTAKREAEQLKAELHDRETEIMQLKARLYDLMTKDRRGA